MEIYYINHLNEKINLSAWPIAIDDVTPLFAKKWDYEAIELKGKNKSKLQRFYMTSKSIKVKIQVFADSKEEYKKCMNDLFEITETDILNMIPGKLCCNGYYLKCYIIVDEPREYEENLCTVDSDMEILSIEPQWIKEEIYYFDIKKEVSTNNKKYAYRYAYRYANGMNNTYIVNPNFTPSNFKLIIYGPVVNPMVTVGSNAYLVNIVLDSGEYLEIDSCEETITKVMKMGERVNAFHNRQKKKKFFTKIQPGRQTVTWTGKFAFDLILYEERSEPKWSKL